MFRFITAGTLPVQMSVGLTATFRLIPYDDPEDLRPSYGDKGYSVEGFKVRAIFVNRKHLGYEKCDKEGVLVDHLLRLITNELVGMNYEGSETAMEAANRLYGIAVVKS